MTHQTLQHPVKIYLELLSLLVISAALVGSPSDSPAQEKKDKTASEAGKNTGEQIRRQTERLVRGIEIEIRSDDKWIKVEHIEKPLLFYSEPTRNNDRGSVWGWAQKGRPVALLELFQDSNDRTRWVFALCNTSGGKLRASQADAPWWRANDSAAGAGLWRKPLSLWT